MQIEIENTFKISTTNLKLLYNQLNDLLDLKIESLYLHIISDEEILKINRLYLNHDYYTDIITFDLRDERSQDAEIYISLERVRDNAKNMNIAEDDELYRVCIHGMLHLFGIEDKTLAQKATMRKLESKYINNLFHVKP